MHQPIFLRLCCVVIAISSVLPREAFAQRDTSTMPAFNRHAPRTSDEQMVYDINHVGGHPAGLSTPAHVLSQSAPVVVIGLPAVLFASGLGAKDADETAAGITILSAELTSALAVEGIKAIVQRPRPYHEIEGLIEPDSLEPGYSFPSGHATASWALATGLSLHFPKWYVIAPSALYALTVSLSRPYLGVHYVTDILTGALFGSAMSYLNWRLEQSLRGGGWTTVTTAPTQQHEVRFAIPVN